MILKLALFLLLSVSLSATLFSVSADFRVSYEASHEELAHVYY
jgi:hypothetical protein